MTIPALKSPSVSGEVYFPVEFDLAFTQYSFLSPGLAFNASTASCNIKLSKLNITEIESGDKTAVFVNGAALEDGAIFP